MGSGLPSFARTFRRALVGAAAWCLAPVAAAASAAISVAAASDLVFCLPQLNAEFRRREPDATVTVATGSSGNFFAQIKNGAPYDVFLSADLGYPRALIAAGAAVEESLVTYAVGRLVLWTRRTDLEFTDLAAALRSPLVRKLALANPAHAPYGRAAREALEKLGVWTELQPRIVLGENISQAAQFVQSGSADAGIVALSLALVPALRDTGRRWDIPASLHAPLEQGAVLTPRGTANGAARRYLAFLASEPAKKIFRELGYGVK